MNGQPVEIRVAVDQRGEIANPSEATPGFLRSMAGKQQSEILPRRGGNCPIADDYGVEILPEGLGRQGKRHVSAGKIPMEIDREIAVRMDESILAQVREKGPPVGSRSVGGSIAELAEHSLGIVDLLPGHDDIDVDILAARHVAMKKSGQGRPLEGGIPEARPVECLAQAAQLLRYEQRTRAVDPPEVLERTSRCRRHGLPRHPIEALDKLRADSVVLGKLEQLGEVDAAAQDFQGPTEIRPGSSNTREKFEFGAAGIGAGGNRKWLRSSCNRKPMSA